MANIIKQISILRLVVIIAPISDDSLSPELMIFLPVPAGVAKRYNLGDRKGSGHLHQIIPGRQPPQGVETPEIHIPGAIRQFQTLNRRVVSQQGG